MEELYDVFIVHAKTNEIVSCIGKSLTEAKAVRRMDTGLQRINEDYFVTDADAGFYQVGDEWRG